MLKKYKILVVEDDTVIQNNLKDLLSAYGYWVYTASCGEEALTNLKQNLPDLILCDIMMRGMDGFALLERLNHMLEYPVPFIFLTARSDMESLRNGMNLGADDYIFKPYKADVLLKAIETRLRKYSRFSRLNDDQVNQFVNYNDTFFVNTRSGKIPISISSIKIIRSDADYSILTLSDKTCIHVKKALKDWERLLPSNKFARVHRAVIINIDYISKIEKGFNRQLFIRMQGLEEVITASNRCSCRIRELTLD